MPPINLHHKDNIYYLVLVAILMHNMMVEARLQNDKVESAELYNTLSAKEAQSTRGETIDYIEGMESLLMESQDDQLEREYTYNMVMKRWASLYDRDGAQKLKRPQ